MIQLKMYNTCIAFADLAKSESSGEITALPAGFKGLWREGREKEKEGTALRGNEKHTNRSPPLAVTSSSERVQSLLLYITRGVNTMHLMLFC